MNLKKLSIIAICLVLIFATGISSISAAQNNKPTLEGGALLYTINDNISTYRFIVMYKDADGDLPKYMFVYINGSRRSMTKADALDLNTKDGVLYTLQLTHDELSEFMKGKSEWSVQYSFRTNDGHGVVKTEENNSMTLDYEQMGLIMEHSSGSGLKCGK